jgi:5-methylcytosine-specific restriction endonuclease McrA
MRSQTGRRLTSDELITELKRVYSLTGRDCLTREDFDDRSITSYRTIRSRFGSWAIALKIAGIPQSELANKNWTEAQCFENLADVWVHYQRQPSYREMSQPPSMIRGKIYATRWGTWHKALRAFADSANSEDQLSGENEKVPVSGISGPVPPRISRKPEDRREVRPALRIKVLSRDRFRCVFCGRSPATHLNIHDFHIDHILAVVNGGKTTLDNLQTLCPDCNLGKGRMVLPRVTPDFTTN